MKLYILRHGTTDWNRTGRLQGACDIPLNEEGIALAHDTALGMKDVPLDCIFSSPLKRAYVTAQIVSEGRGLDIIIDNRLREISFGDWEGKICKGEHAEVTPEDMRRYNNLSDGTLKAENGESLNEVIERAEDFMKDILSRKELEDKNILISTHGAFSRALLHYYWQDNDFWHGQVPPNCSVSILTAKDGQLIDLIQDHIYYQSKPENFYDI